MGNPGGDLVPWEPESGSTSATLHGSRSSEGESSKELQRCLEDVVMYLQRYVSFGGPERALADVAADLVALWIAHTIAFASVGPITALYRAQ